MGKGLDIILTSEKERKESFSYPINHLIGWGFGAAFLVFFLANAVLLFLSVDSITEYYWKVFCILGIYLALYGISTYLVSSKIKKMFEPLDEIANALAEDKIRIYGDSADLEMFAQKLSVRMQELNDISDELVLAKDDLNDIYQENEENRSKLEHQINRSRENLDGIKKNRKWIVNYLGEIHRTLEDCRMLETSLKISGQAVKEDTESLNESFKECNHLCKEIMEDRERLKGIFEILSNMQNESIELIESIYNEISYIQGIIMNLDLFATNTSLEYARSGGMSSNLTGAMNELKLMTRNIRDKMDELAMSVIRTKNSLKLSNDQAEFCINSDEEECEEFEKFSESLSIISLKLQGLMEVHEKISNNTDAFMKHYYELGEQSKKIEKELKNLGEQTEKTDIRLENIRQICYNEKLECSTKGAMK